jgi:RND family efflux transporter MFP subunit
MTSIKGVTAETLVKKNLQQVAVISVSKQTGLVRQLLGNVFSPQTQMLSSQVTGVSVSERLVLGHQVTRGETIVQLDTREAQAKYALAQAELATTKIRVKQKKLAFSRLKQSHAKKLTSRAEFDEADLQFQQAQAELLAFEAKSRLAKLNLDKHSINAPFDGFLITSSPVVGKQLMSGEKVVEILNNKDLRVKVAFSYQELSLLKKGHAQLVLNVEKQVPLKLVGASPATVLKSGMIETEFLLPVDAVLNQSSFYSGQAISLYLIDNRLSVPEHAILNDAQGQYVFVVSDGQVTRVPDDDLKIGQEVIVMGADGLVAGDAVSVLVIGDAG